MHSPASPKNWEMRHLSMTTLLSALFLSRGRRNKKLFELVSLWHPTPGALEVDALLKLCLSSLQGHSFGLLPQAPDRSGNIHHTFLASFCSSWELLGDTVRCVLYVRSLHLGCSFKYKALTSTLMSHHTLDVYHFSDHSHKASLPVWAAWAPSLLWLLNKRLKSWLIQIPNVGQDQQHV